MRLKDLKLCTTGLIQFMVSENKDQTMIFVLTAIQRDTDLKIKFRTV